MTDEAWQRTELHRRACEARWVLGLPEARREAYLALVLARRGEEGWRVLMRDVAAVEMGGAPC